MSFGSWMFSVSFCFFFAITSVLFQVSRSFGVLGDVSEARSCFGKGRGEPQGATHADATIAAATMAQKVLRTSPRPLALNIQPMSTKKPLCMELYEFSSLEKELSKRFLSPSIFTVDQLCVELLWCAVM